jgi:GT2 family glycosyltransferase/2-polyprenyl-3-methyl-5-hydroxy-6-metoxy-1,4-benzoquinol methylase
MSLRRLALVFDNTRRPETTGLYCRRALSSLVSVEHLLPRNVERIRPGEYDAVLVIDDVRDDPLPTSIRPLVYWAIDTHIDYARSLARARACDLVFAAQAAGAERLRADGCPTATWLPLACDPILHGRVATPLTWDWSFVGHLFPGPRSALLERLMAEFPTHFVGQAPFQEMARVYSGSRVVVNRSLADDLNMRVFEGLCSGALLLTNALPEARLPELLVEERHLVTFTEPDEAADKLRALLRDAPLRESIARRGRAEVLARHTYRHRMEIVLQAIESRPAVTSMGIPSVPVPQPRVAPKDRAYFEWDRPDVLAMIPETARRMLDLGCGGGRLGAHLKQRQPCEVWGVERDAAAAERARSRLDQVETGDVSDPALSFPAQTFDAIVCADILEHLRRPQDLLRRCREWLAPGGRLIASLPNIQHHSVLTGLLEGNFTYEPAGLLDEDHVRCFTRREIEKLLERSGFQVETLRIVPGRGWDEWTAAGQPGEVRIGGLTIAGLSRERAADFFAYQFLVIAQPVPPPEWGLTSIILVTHNQGTYTRQCLESVRFRTDEPYELIVVDNGSTDGTPEYLEAEPDVLLIRNTENRGFPAAVNQGMAVARGAQLLLLNNDTVVTTGWLRRLLTALHAEPQIGLVGPVSNQVSGPQQIDVPYRDLSGLDGFAWDWGRRHARQVVDLDRLVGFCLLLKRDDYEALGGLDEQFGVGNFEDDDYCRRARLAGYRTVVAVDSFVHHFGGRTFLASGVDFAALMAENEAKYRRKWADHGVPTTVGHTRSTMTNAPRPKLSLCMIVRDNEATIRPCLESIRPWVDELIVVDTGSTDATPRICAELGARVHHWAWRDDFSAARNESLKYATGEWIFWMDSDDTIPATCGRRLRELVDGAHAPNVDGYVMQVHCPGPAHGEHAPDVTVVDHIKLFRNRPDLRFEHRIHEQILPAIRRAGREVVFTDIYVIHSGSDHSDTGRARKLERDFRLLALDLEERPDHPFVLFNLGMTHADAGRHAEAADWLQRCLAVSHPEESHVRKAYALLVSVRYQQQRFLEAYEICSQARRLYADDKELLFRQAMLQHQLGRLEAAVQSYTAVLNDTAERHFASVDWGITGHKARHNLALVLEDLGRFEEAEAQWGMIQSDTSDRSSDARQQTGGSIVELVSAATT